MKKLIVLILISILLLGSSRAHSNEDSPSANSSLLSSNETALLPDSLQYLGAFRLPADAESETQMFSYGGEAIAFCSSGNNDYGSLYLTGHNWYTYVAEITIPAPILSRNIGALPVAEVLQPLSDIRNGLFSDWTLEMPRVGLEVLDDQLYFCWGEHLEEDVPLGTHGVTGLDLSTSTADTVLRVDAPVYATNDYIFAIPDTWSQLYLDGFNLATGRFRDGGWSGMGPSLYAISSDEYVDDMLSAVALIQYDMSYEGDNGAKMNQYSHADWWAGGAWITSAQGDAVIFAGTHGFGDTWYGFSNGVVWPTDGAENAIYPRVPEWPHDARGWWNNDFRAAVIFYNPSQLAAVVAGDLAANEIQPYALIDISEYMLTKHDETDMQHIGGVAYDRESNLLYIQELFAEEDKPIVHVFAIE